MDEVQRFWPRGKTRARCQSWEFQNKRSPRLCESGGERPEALPEVWFPYGRRAERCV